MSGKCKDVKCTSGKICNPETGKCVSKTGRIGKNLSLRKSNRKSTSRRKTNRKSTSRRKTNRKSNRKSTSKRKSNRKSARKTPCPSGYIRNPETGRCVKRTSKIGMILTGKLKLVRSSNFKTQLKRGSSTEIKNIYVPKIRTSPKFQARNKDNCIIRSNIPLTYYQQEAVKAFNRKEGLALFFDPGMGKTITAISCAECFLDKNPNSHVVVITLVSLLNNFTKEFKKYGDSINQSLYTFVSYDTFLSNFKKNKNFAYELCHNCLLIIDEVHELRDYDSKTYRAVMQGALFSKKVLVLTATPFVNKICDFIPIINLLHRKYLIGPNVSANKQIKQVSVMEQILQGKKTLDIEIDPLLRAPTKIACTEKAGTIDIEKVKEKLEVVAGLLRGLVCFVPRDENDPNYPKQVIHDIAIPMSTNYEENSHTMLREYFTNPEAFYNGYRRVVNAFDEDYISEKLTSDTVKNILTNPENHTLIFTNWLEHGVEIISKIMNEYGVNFTVIAGSNSPEERQQSIQLFNSGLVPNLIITTAGIAGIDLVGVTDIIVLDPVWNDANFQQIIGRGVRYKSHAHLPPEKQVVNIWLLKLLEKFIYMKIIDPMYKDRLGQELKRSVSGDYFLYNIIERKQRINEAVRDMLRRVSAI